MTEVTHRQWEQPELKPKHTYIWCVGGGTVKVGETKTHAHQEQKSIEVCRAKCRERMRCEEYREAIGRPIGGKTK